MINDMREAMRREMEVNLEIINSVEVKRNSPRELKDKVFYAMARNNVISHFLNLDREKQRPSNFYAHIPISEDYLFLMKRVGAKKYPLEIKRSAELDLIRDYTHRDYKKRLHFIDEPLPVQPTSHKAAEKVGLGIGAIIVFCIQNWWIVLILFIAYAIWDSNSTKSHSPYVSSNTFNSGGVRGGNSATKNVSDSHQVRDGSGQAGYGNNGTSGHDAPSDVPLTTTPGEAKPQIGKSTTQGPNRTFTLGSSKQEVEAVLGKPNGGVISNQVMGDTWIYGVSSVSFDIDEKVTGWSKLIIGPFIGDKNYSSKAATVGSTKQEVINSRGTPDTVRNYGDYGDIWSYGEIDFSFDPNGRVKFIY